MMKRARYSGRLTATVAAAVAFAIGLGVGTAVPIDVQLPPFLLGGIQVNEPDLDRWLEGLVAEGMNTVAVTDYARQGDWDSYNLFWDDDREGVIREIRAAKVEGLRVVLVLRVALDHAFPRNRFLWHGMIHPTSEEDLTEWFARYRRFAHEWARIAEREGVDLLMIGSEMNALASTTPADEIPVLEEYYLDDEKQEKRRDDLLGFEERLEPRHLWIRFGESYGDLATYLDDRIATEQAWASTVAVLGDDDPVAALNSRRARLDREWRGVAAAVRDAYSGPIGYAANFDQYPEVSFWDALDVMGINAYFELRAGAPEETEGPGSLLEALRDGWSDVLARIDAVRGERGVADMPVVFTELGYTRRRGATIHPWAGAGFFILERDGVNELFLSEDQAADLNERALAVRALYEADRERGGLLGGVLYWKLSTVGSHTEIEPFVALLDQPGAGDPMLQELRRFVAK